MTFTRYSRALLDQPAAKVAKLAKAEAVPAVAPANALLNSAKAEDLSYYFSRTLAAPSQQKAAEVLGFSRFSSFSSKRDANPAPEPQITAYATWAKGIEHLLLMPVPASYPAHAWQCLLDDAGRFMERWAAQAVQLGWQDWQLWGTHRCAPWQRIDAMGLVPLIRGKTVVALIDVEAVIRTRTGALQRYRRRPSDPLRPSDRAMIWELG